ncbi:MULTISPECIES: DEAD/DEAH box helicase family protein [unclassified Bradyrhizobium]|uniref:DEAD/DEAH box helicase n=1 Tax=unclassified Bradyrhizobium TaxID=2631580 RepID=UPI001FF91472|nr:DEAD/DEAH box helicase family protein [Bradyrhizobium sp. 84]MCK1372131.1 DEAD/DEAH box helicase family protein [Bradyrhizobium sp. 49]MCK1430668.1 DEAD/DEAH box helicase family protein [Bradyrhizobium sp. 87]
MAKVISDFLQLRLWQHQQDAVIAGERYFASGSKRGALIHMPTGTGKTGVMAVLGMRRAATAPVLVVCPSAALVAQLMTEFSGRFWDTIGAPAEWRPDAVIQALPGSVDVLETTLLKSAGSVIIVATIQAIQQIHAAGEIGRFKGRIGTVIFDEGHREPAPLWAAVVREFNVPTVLFSATPFRGDLKIFNVDDAQIHFLSFERAVEDCLIRGVTIEIVNLSDDARTFAAQIIAASDRLVRSGELAPDHKVIVRGGSEDTVIDLFEAFRGALAGRGDGVMAVHNNFSAAGDKGAFQRNEVPSDLKKRSERFLIHQFMLVEGIDDPKCALLAIFEPFGNTRMLVQQIGRLTRQSAPIGTKMPDARVLTRLSDGTARDWHSFLDYDRACVSNGGKPPLRNGADVLRGLVSALPEIDYIEGRFRTRIDLDDDNISDDLRFPRAAIVYDVADSFGMDRFQAEVTAELDAEDRFQHQTRGIAGGACRYHVTMRLNQSPFLAKALFQTASLEVTIYALVGRRLYFYDSAGLWIDELNGIGSRARPINLRSLLPDHADNSVSFLAVKNTDLGPSALRARTLSARSLERAGMFMGEHMNVVTRATGWTQGIRRTVGFSRSRVRDGAGNELSVSEFMDWCAEVDVGLAAAPPASPILSRFATPTDTPADTTPVNILVDMLELSGQFNSSAGTGAAQFDADGLCVDIERDDSKSAPAPFRFILKIDGTDVKVWIKWEAKKKKYWLTSPALSGVKSKAEAKISLAKRLNQLQPFRVITAALQHAYVNGAFYALDLDLAKPTGPGRLVLDLVVPVPGLGAVTSEKGSPRGGAFNTWRRGSLFRLIDDALRKAGGTREFGAPFPALVCDDFGTEGGDFIGVDGRPSSARVAFVVAKHRAGDPSVSASAFYDVCAQGVKNLAFLKSDGDDLPGGLNKFDQSWRLSEGKGKAKKTDTVPRRRAGPSSAAFRRMLADVKRNPGAERDIWLVCAGGMLSKAALEREFKSTPPKAHVLQFYHLVISMYSACQSVGVNLKIFCAI